MHRIRLSFPHYKKFGWLPTVITVGQQYSDVIDDPLLMESIPGDITVHRISALNKRWTSKFGLGSLALRSFFSYKKYGDKLLEKEHFDLIFFSTTEFPICVLGRHWKSKFKIPYVIDMQDPWHTDYYKDKPKVERPAKYWFSYRLNKFLEPLAMRYVSGLISVSQTYIIELAKRYSELNSVPHAVITFPSAARDFEIADSNKKNLATPLLLSDRINLVYVGRGGHDLKQSASHLFSAFKIKLSQWPEIYSKLMFYFIGTSYASPGKGLNTIKPVAESKNIGDFVFEQPDRIPYFENLAYLNNANGLIILGSDDPGYTASKIYPYILSGKPLLAILNPQSSAAGIIRDCNAGIVADSNSETDAIAKIIEFLENMVNGSTFTHQTNWERFSDYSALALTQKQCDLFDQAILS